MVEAVYSYPYQSHAPMEPMNATALYTAEKCEVWCPTQNGEAALAAVAEAAGLPVAKCDVYKTLLGGGFGRRGAGTDYVRQAVLIAKQMPGTPVKLIWTREEDMTHGFYHPITQCKLRGGLDAAGNLVGLHMRISGQSILAALLPQNLQGRDGPDAVFQGLTEEGPEGKFGYNVPNLLIDHAMRNPHIRPGFWRGVNTNHNAIYIECFIDELAHAAGQDPLEFRRKMLKPKHLAVLNAAAEQAGYGKAPAGRYHGLAQIMGYGSYVAAVAEVSVGEDGRLKIHRIVAATNPGHVVNPAQIERQVAGSFVYGLSAMLYGEITVNGGAVEQTNFDTYNVMRIDEMPQVETVIVPTGDFWGGVGEPTIAVAAPAVLNAIFAATGKRIRTMPLMNHDLKGGLSATKVAGLPADRGERWSGSLDPLRLWIRPRRMTMRSGARACRAAAFPPARPKRRPGASSCSGCHAASAAVETPVPRLAGLPAPRDRRRRCRRSAPAQRPATIMAAHRQGLLRRRDRGDRGVVCRAAGAVSHADRSSPPPHAARRAETRRAGRRGAVLRSGAGAGGRAGGSS